MASKLGLDIRSRRPIDGLALVRRSKTPPIRVGHRIYPLFFNTLLGAGSLPIAEPAIERTVGAGVLLGLAADALFWVLWRPRPNATIVSQTERR